MQVHRLDTQDKSHTEQEAEDIVTVWLPAGPLGIIFEWSDDGLVVSEFLPIPTTGLKGAAELDGKIVKGAVLSSVNGENVTGLEYDDVMAQIRMTTEQPNRKFQFRQPQHNFTESIMPLDPVSQSEIYPHSWSNVVAEPMSACMYIM
jgi:hypothetical protein